MPSQEINIRLSLQGGAQVSTGLQSVVQQFSALRAAIASSAVVFASLRIVDFIGDAIEAADAAGKMAEKVGVSVEQLTALQYASNLANVSNEALQQGFKKFSQELVKAGNANADVLEEMLKVSDEFARMENGAYKTSRAIELFGKSGQDLIPLLNQGSAAIREQMEEAKRFGVVITQDLAASADKFRDNLDRLKAISHGVALQLANELLPDLIRLSELFLKISAEGGVVANAVGVIGNAFRGAIETIDSATSSAKSFFLFLANPVGAIAAGTATAAAKTLTAPFEQAFTDLGKKVEEALNPKAAQQPIISAEDMEKAIKLLEDLRLKYLQITDAQFAAKSAELARGEAVREQLDKLLIDETTANQVRVANAQLAIATIDQINAQAWQKEQDRLLAEERERKRILQMRVDATKDALQNAAQAALMFGRKGFVAFKAFSTAQAIISTAESAIKSYNALAGIPYVGPILGAAAAAAAIAAGAAQIAVINSTNPPGFMTGGYTGDGPAGEVAGLVHRKEFVFSAPQTERVGRGNLEAIASGSESAITNNISADNHVNVALLQDRAALRQWLKQDTSAKRIILDMVSGERMELGIA